MGGLFRVLVENLAAEAWEEGSGQGAGRGWQGHGCSQEFRGHGFVPSVLMGPGVVAYNSPAWATRSPPPQSIFSFFLVGQRP